MYIIILREIGQFFTSKEEIINLQKGASGILQTINSVHALISLKVNNFYTSAVLRLECSIDCISGSVGHQQNIFRSFSHCQRFL